MLCTSNMDGSPISCLNVIYLDFISLVVPALQWWITLSKKLPLDRTLTLFWKCGIWSGVSHEYFPRFLWWYHGEDGHLWEASRSYWTIVSLSLLVYSVRETTEEYIAASRFCMCNTKIWITKKFQTSVQIFLNFLANSLLRKHCLSTWYIYD